MKIIFFSRLFYPHIGGVEKHIYEISKLLIEKGHSVHVVTELHDEKLKSHDTYKNITISRIPIMSSERFKKYIIWLWIIKNIKVIRGADIIHCHDVFYWYLPFRFMFPKKKVFTTFHGYEGNNIPDKKAIIMHKIAERLSMGNICIGNYFKKWYGTKSTYVSFGAVDILKEVNKIPVNQSHAIFNGRLEEEAGILEYLKALKILKENSHNLSLTILGDGSLKKNAEMYCKKNKLDINFKGFVKNIYKYSKPAKYIFTSRYLGIIEAMSMKKLVFAQYNNLIKKDYLYMTPFAKYIVIAKNPEELSSKIKYYMKHKKEEKRLVTEAFKWVESQTWLKMTNTYLTLWRK